MDITRNKWINILAPSILIIFGWIISFKQYNHTSIDGDLIWHVLPYGGLEKVLKDPLGLDAVLNHNIYRGAGRWFCHWMTYNSFRHGYFFINHLGFNKIEALFLTSTFIQWISQWLLVIAISLYSNLSRRITVKNFLWSAATAFFFFRYKNGYNVAIIDHAVTYTIFYAFPFSLLLFFFYPFFRLIFYTNSKQRFNLLTIGIIIILGLILVFSGPLIPVLGVMFSSVIMIILILKNYHGSFSLRNIMRSIVKINLLPLILLACFILLWLYDYYVGTFNNENTNTTTLAQRYQLMCDIIPSYLFTGGLPYLLALVLLNYILFRKYAREKLKTKEYRYLLIIFVTVVAYLFLLPMGGYRLYRPNIWRYDVTIPLTIFLIIIIISSGIILFNTIDKKLKVAFVSISTVLLFVFWIQNFPIQNTRKGQQEMMEILQTDNSDTVYVFLNSSLFFDWGKIEDTTRAYPVSQMLFEWGITKKPLKFYQK